MGKRALTVISDICFTSQGTNSELEHFMLIMSTRVTSSFIKSVIERAVVENATELNAKLARSELTDSRRASAAMKG